MYSVLIVLAFSMVLVACDKAESEKDYYTFDTSVYDETPNISSDSVVSLFKNGITVKRFEDKNYFIKNYLNNDSTLNDSVIEFGPLTIDTYKNYYKIDIVDKGNNNVRVKIDITLISKFNKTLYNSEFRPSWVCWTSNQGFVNVTNLTPIIINYVNGINEGDYIYLRIYWDTTRDLIDNKNILLSVESINKYGNNEAFREILTFSLNRFN